MFLFIFREDKAWHYVWIVSGNVSLISLENKKKKKRKKKEKKKKNTKQNKTTHTQKKKNTQTKKKKKKKEKNRKNPKNNQFQKAACCKFALALKLISTPLLFFFFLSHVFFFLPFSFIFFSFAVIPSFFTVFMHCYFFNVYPTVKPVLSKHLWQSHKMVA